MAEPDVIAHQASCLAVGPRGLLIEGAPGSGKSSLVLALLDRGGVLVGDDGVMLDARDGALFALPHPNTRGLLEVRNVGIVERPVREEAQVALVLVLDSDAPRFVDHPERCWRAGIELPLLRLWPDSPVLALRAETALARFGLDPR